MSYHYTGCRVKFYVDDWNDPLIVGKKWHMWGKYVATYVNREQIYLHKIIAALIGLIGMIDHKDRDKLNNAEDNLEETTYSKNNSNKGLQRRNTSGRIGVTWFERENKWYSRITFEKKSYHLYCSSSREDAAYAWDLGTIFFRGPNAPELNFESNRLIYAQEIKDNKIYNIYSLQTYLKKKFS